MLKLYRRQGDSHAYWETWTRDDGVHVIHFGELGTRGTTKEITCAFVRKSPALVKTEIEARRAEGFREVADEDERTLLIEYAVDGHGTVDDHDKRARLEARMDETLGWTGLGHCDGGSMGSGTMEVCCFVVDFALAKRVIEDDLRGTEFANYTRIYDEDGDD